MLTVPQDFSPYLFEKRLTEIRTQGIGQSKTRFHASVTEVSNVCSPNKSRNSKCCSRHFLCQELDVVLRNLPVQCFTWSFPMKKLKLGF